MKHILLFILHTSSLILLSAASSNGKPNLLIFLSDDLSARDLGCYGATDVRTPHMDRLAAEGLVFDQAFIISPACAPSRTAMLTGLTPVHNGSEANHTYKHDHIPSLIPELNKLGYRTAAFGKVAHGKDIGDHQFHHHTKSIAPSEIEAWLDEQPADTPIALFVGTKDPHVPWPKPEDYSPEEVTIPPFHIDTPDTRLFRAMYYTDVTRADKDLGNTLSIVEKRWGKDFFTLFSSDHGAQWPFGKWNLYDEGIRVPLIVRWPGQTQASTRSSAMVSWIDLIPTLLDVAGTKANNELDGRSFKHTFTNPFAIHRDQIFTTHDNDGRANVYPIRSVRTHRWKYIRNLQPDWIHSTHSSRYRKDTAGAYHWSWEEAAAKDPNAALILNRLRQRPGEELYDLENDPNELNNLAADPRHADTLLSLRQDLTDWMREQEDDGQVTPEPWLPGQPDLLAPHTDWSPYYKR
ncbi:sulfatase family protein [Pelagicoccus mobilis]|uniref:Sulfatase n=1 Tax=Pelagicoccus mobilis TaxID=415221 RepID=A0A934RX17_9BACT|nr:sulfatase [Pelagicoccus mobilis]MBK1879310.1 sulfatase [Pelagicoccus mobilis]